MVFPATLELCFFAFILALFIGIPFFGTIAGMRQGKFVDTTISFTSMAGYSFYLLGRVAGDRRYCKTGILIGGRYDLLYEIEHVTESFAMIDAFFAREVNIARTPYKVS